MSKNENEQSSLEKEANVKKKRPKWLKALEAQSWQAELLISGLVVTGLLQAPGYLIHFLEGYIFESTELGFSFLGFASMMIIAGINCLVIFFAFHFLLRGIWVALLGLNSVYPDGIDTTSTKMGGPKYWKIAKERYPDLSTYNLELDKKCSVIFSIATMTIIMLTSLSLLILIVYKVFQVLISFFPFLTDYVVYIGIGIYVLFAVVVLGIQHMAKKYPDNKQIEKFALSFSSVSENIFSLYFFKKPIGYITNIHTSNDKSKYGMLVIMLFSFILGFSGADQTNDNPIFKYFGEDKYYSFNNRPHRFQTFNYDNLRGEGQSIFTPSIAADQVSGKLLKLFIPTVPREKEAMGIEDLSFSDRVGMSFEARDSIYQLDLQRYKDFNKVFINDIAYENLDFQFFQHPNQGERGVLTIVPTADFKEGKNILEIRKEYFSKKGVQKIVAIPFYFER